MDLKFHMMILLLLCLLNYSEAQVETDTEGRTQLFFGNYTGAFVLHGIKPTVWFHPVLGGSDIRYIRYQNFITCSVSAFEEVDSAGNVITKVSSDELKWIFGYKEETDNQTGNIHSTAFLTGTNEEGFIANLIVESWTQGSTHYYGTYLTTVPPDFVEVSFNVTGFKFKNSTNNFWLRIPIKMDSFGLPIIDKSNNMQYKATLSSLHTRFSIWLMTNGFLDGKFQRFDYTLTLNRTDLSSLEFILKSKSFNQSYQYDPNFSVLLQTEPLCDSIGGCNHGACVEEGVCKCFKNYVGTNCNTYDTTATTGHKDYGHSIPIWISISLALMLIVGLGVGLGMFMRRRQKLRANFNRALRKSDIIGI